MQETVEVRVPRRDEAREYRRREVRRVKKSDHVRRAAEG